MENMDNKQNGEMMGGKKWGMGGMGVCGCGTGSGCGCGKWHILRMILGLIFIIMIFWSGFKLGEITGSIRGAYGHGMMRGSSFGMMNNDNYSNDTSDMTTLPSTATPVK